MNNHKAIVMAGDSGEKWHMNKEREKVCGKHMPFL